MDFDLSLLSKMGCSLASRVLSFLLKNMGFSGGIVLAIGFAVRALLATDAAPSLGNMMLPSEDYGASSSEASVNQAPGGNDAGPSNAGPSNVAPADSPWRSFPSVPADLSPLPSDASIPSLPSLPSLPINEREPSGTGQEGAAAQDRNESESSEPPAKRPRKGPMPAEGAGPSNAGLAQASGQPREGTSGGEESDGPPNTPGEIRSKLGDFLSAYGKRRASQPFVERTATELGLEEASPDKLRFVSEQIDRLRRDMDPTHPTSSGQNAAAALTLAVAAWEKQKGDG